MSVMTTWRAPTWRATAARHDADRPGAGDQHVLADEVEGERGVDGIAERIEDGADLVVDPVGQRHDVEGGDAHIFGEGAGQVDADALGVGIEVELARRALARLFMPTTWPSPETRWPTLRLRDVGADVGDLAGIFMADDHRHRHGLLRPVVPIVDVDVGAADAGLVHLDQHIVRARSRGSARSSIQMPGSGLALTRAFIEITPRSPSAPASVKASTARSISVEARAPPTSACGCAPCPSARREEEAGDVDAALVERRRHLLRELRVAEHHRDDRRLAGEQLEAGLGHGRRGSAACGRISCSRRSSAASAISIALSEPAATAAPGVGEQIGPRALAQEIDDRLRARR